MPDRDKETSTIILRSGTKIFATVSIVTIESALTGSHELGKIGVPTEGGRVVVMVRAIDAIVSGHEVSR